MFDHRAEAALSGDRDAVYQAVMLDPLTGAVCTLKQIREMASEMLEAQRQWLPELPKIAWSAAGSDVIGMR